MPAAHLKTAASSRLARASAMALALAILVFGLYTEDWKSLPWALVAMLVYGAAVALQFTRSVAWRVYGLWFGVFMVAQALLTPIMQGDYAALPPGMTTTIDVRTDAIAGYAKGKRQVSTDERGYRVQPRVNYTNKVGPRIIAIGGSTTEDIMLDDRSTWTHRLQLRLAPDFPGVHVVNTGLSGLRAANHLATLRVVLELQPDLVLLLVGGNDWNKQIKDHFEPGRDGWTPLPLRQTALPRVLNKLVIAPLRVKLSGRTSADTEVVIAAADGINGGNKMYAERSTRHSYVPSAVPASYTAQLEQFAALCRDHRLRCLFLSQPHAYGPPAPAAGLVARFWMTPPYADYGLDLDSMSKLARLYNDHLKSVAARTHQGFCDLAGGMQPLQSLFYDDMHFTDDGAQRVADLVSPCVVDALRVDVKAAPPAPVVPSR